ncbi:hypothetical protein KALB_4133 [Kutzneria albida DSM 43870]|uniref:Uncharacterized protein n=1 Tax=Kutzneria albida DSM 43870 TaxID=1449976 RepID=W5W960_9PSEU|nr:hypothetical protein KALB_4133 [Kutzneria albida DSM 43870]
MGCFVAETAIMVAAVATGELTRNRKQQLADALRTIAVTGREAVAELRRILGLLRESETGTKPQSGVGALGELIGKVRPAGRPVCRRPSGSAGGIRR